MLNISITYIYEKINRRPKQSMAYTTFFNYNLLKKKESTSHTID